MKMCSMDNVWLCWTRKICTFIPVCSNEEVKMVQVPFPVQDKWKRWHGNVPRDPFCSIHDEGSKWLVPPECGLSNFQQWLTFLL